jgi:hypothetical protein
MRMEKIYSLLVKTQYLSNLQRKSVIGYLVINYLAVEQYNNSTINQLNIRNFF